MNQQYKYSFLPRTIILVFLIVIYSPVSAGFEDLGVGANALAMGNAFIGLANTSDAVFINPAGLSLSPNLEFSTFYSRPFGLKELSYSTFSCKFSTPYVYPAIGIQTFGYNIYRENSFNISLARHYENKIFYGMTFRYMHLAIKNYGSTGTMGVDLGIIIRASTQFSLGFVAKNVNRPTIGRHKESIPQIYATGILVKPFPALRVTFDIYKDIRFPVEPRMGIEYRLFNNLFLRAGSSWEPAHFSAGFGLGLKMFNLNYAFYSHLALNLTHQLSITFTIPKREIKESERRFPVRISPRGVMPRDKRIIKPEPAVQAVKTPRTDDKLPDETGQKLPKLPKLKPGETININTASQAQLVRLPGVGPKTAQAIINYRTEKGLFVTLAELTEVKGIGLAKYKKLRLYMRLKD